MTKIIYTILYSITPFLIFAQSYDNWMTGDTSDFVTTDHLPGVVLAGGAGDNDDAMKWMLNRAGGGDVIVLRASGSDGYNDYFFSDLGVNVNSVETIRFNTADAAFDDYVLTQIQNAEIIFMAGGDQYDYYQYWKDTPVEDALNSLINDKQITIGGTSAGMAILGEVYYAPPGGSLDSEEALGNPFHPDTDLIGQGDFLDIPILSGVITDTHYDQRERAGRHLTFLARMINDFGMSAFGIASNEYTAVCVDENGVARAFGEYPAYDDFAYFLSSQCNEDLGAEIVEDGIPLTWNRQGTAVAVYKVPGTIGGENTFDLNDWQTGNGGEWEQWYAIEGELSQVAVDSICDFSTSVEQVEQTIAIDVFPNPTADFLTIKISQFEKNASFEITNVLGQVIFSEPILSSSTNVDLQNQPKGLYQLNIIGGINFTTQIVKK